MSMSAELIRVLVVEDDEVSAKAVRVMLERLACSVEIVEDGAKAVERFRTNKYDLVLMGWQMPVMDGFEATARIRTMLHGKEIPIIGTTAGRDRAECMAAGMNDLMPKPFRIEKLRLVLLRWTAWPGVKESGKCNAGEQPVCDTLPAIAPGIHLNYNCAHSPSAEGGCATPMSAPSEAAGLLEHLVFEIAEGVSGQTGEAFFRSLARHLAAALKADFVLVGALQPGGSRIATLAAYGDGQNAPAFEYDLEGTPCANVVEKRLCSYPSGIQGMFPKDLLLGQMGAEGYVGSPMIDSSGRCLGLVCALTRQPLQHAKLAETVLQIFAVRASSELERKNYEEELARSEQHYRALVSHGNEAVLRVELDQPISLDLPEQEQLDLIYQHAYVADCNEQAAKLFGRATAQELIGARMEAISPRDDAEQIERTLAGIRARWQFSQVERTMQGRVLLMTRQGIIEDGKYTGAWVTARDITELKQAEAEVLPAQRRAQAARRRADRAEGAAGTGQCLSPRRDQGGPQQPRDDRQQPEVPRAAGSHPAGGRNVRNGADHRRDRHR